MIFKAGSLMRPIFRAFMLLLTSSVHSGSLPCLCTVPPSPRLSPPPFPQPRPASSWCQVASQSSRKDLRPQLSRSCGYTPFYLFLIFVFCHLTSVLTLRTCEVVFTAPFPSSPACPLFPLHLLPSPVVMASPALVRNPVVLSLSLFFP